ERRPGAPGLQSHAARTLAAECCGVPRRQGLEGGPFARKYAGRILVPGGHPDERPARAHYVYLEPQKNPPRSSRSGQVRTAGNDPRNVAEMTAPNASRPCGSPLRRNWIWYVSQIIVGVLFTVWLR